MKKILTVLLLWTALCGTAFSQNASDYRADPAHDLKKYFGRIGTKITIEDLAQYFGMKVDKKTDKKTIQATVQTAVQAYGKDEINNEFKKGGDYYRVIREIGEIDSQAWLKEAKELYNKLSNDSSSARDNLKVYIERLDVRLTKNEYDYLVRPDGDTNARIWTFERSKFTVALEEAKVALAQQEKAAAEKIAAATTAAEKAAAEKAAAEKAAAEKAAEEKAAAEKKAAEEMAAAIAAAEKKSASGQNAGDFTVDANGVITKYTGFDTVVAIPATIKGKKITAIGKEAFKQADLTIVTIPDGVTYIGESAFANNKLTSVTIPSSVKSIGDEAFNGNPSIETIVLSEGVERVGYRAFSGSKLKSVTFPSTIKVIERESINCDNLTLAANINLVFAEFSSFYSYIANDRKAGTYEFNTAANIRDPNKSSSWIKNPNVQSADGFSYYATPYGAVLTKYNGSSTRVRIPAEIGGLKVKALCGVRGTNAQSKPIIVGTFSKYGRDLEKNDIARVEIPEGITYIGDNSFIFNELASIIIPESVLYIGGGAFAGNKITEITIPDNVIYIGNSAFASNQIASVTIGKGITSINDGTFGNNQLASITIPNYITYLSGFNNNKLTSVTIPNSVTTIGDDAFLGNQLTSITVPNNVTSIGRNAFMENQLTTFTISNGIKSIGDQAFRDNKLTSFNIPNSVPNVGTTYLFWGNNITRVTIGKNVQFPLGTIDSKLQEYYDKAGKAAGTYVARLDHGFIDSWYKQ